MRILIVDDEVVSRKKMHKILESIGKCDTAENGQEALEKFYDCANQGRFYHLITLDVSMPDMDGLEVLKLIREFEIKNNVPKDKIVKILMVTANSDKKTVIDSIGAGCDNYIVKPFNKDVVSEKFTALGLKFIQSVEFRKV